MPLPDGVHPIVITATRADGVTNTVSTSAIIGENNKHITFTPVIAGSVVSPLVLNSVILVTLSVDWANLHPDSFLRKPEYSALVAGDQIELISKTSPDNLQVTMTTDGLLTIIGAEGHVTQSVSYYILDASDGYARSSLGTEVFVNEVSSIETSLILNWDLATPINSNITLNWDVADHQTTQINSSLTINWDVLRITTTPINTELALNWDVTAVVNSNLILNWDIAYLGVVTLQEVTSSLELRWFHQTATAPVARNLMKILAN